MNKSQTDRIRKREKEVSRQIQYMNEMLVWDWQALSPEQMDAWTAVWKAWHDWKQVRV